MQCFALSVARTRHEPSVLFLTLCTLLGCTMTSPTDPSTGVLVEVRRGPVAPVQLDASSNTAPVDGATVLLTDGSGNEITGTTDTTGTARVFAFPGAYQVSVETCPGALHAPPPTSVTVVRGSLASALLVCDTGIR
jgi:hypothetical protein